MKRLLLTLVLLAVLVTELIFTTNKTVTKSHYCHSVFQAMASSGHI